MARDENEGILQPLDTADSNRRAGNDTSIDMTAGEKAVSDGSTDEGVDHDPYAHLSNEEAAILKRQALTPDIKVGYFDLFRYASTADLIAILASSIMAIVSGAAMPLMTVVFGGLQGTFQDYFQGKTSYGEFKSELGKMVLYFVYLAIGDFVATYSFTVGFIYTGERITGRIREHYLENCLRQNIGYFDKIGTGEVVTRITADTNLIQDGISQKIGLSLAAVAAFISAFVIGFVKYWKLALILTSVVVALVLVMGVSSVFVVKYTKESIDAYAPGGSLVDEVISSIRNAVAFGTQARLASQYDNHLKRAERSGFRAKIATAFLMAGMMIVVTLGYALAFWLGGHYVIYEHLPFEKVLVTVMSIIIGAFNIGNVGPHAQAFTTAVAAANKIYATIDRQPPLDPFSESGETLENIQGSIRLEDVRHIYPSRPGVVVMDGVSLTILAGKTTALVGSSGSGKSTIIGIIERFYEPVSGSVYLDGHDMRTLNLKWVRQNISLVSQEPTLFATTIYQNIKYGLVGTKNENMDDKLQMQLVIEAAKKANAHDFISSLPDGYDTQVGDRGFLLSGGQKQRIAIARAIVSDPKILLLDEATSALDTKSEGVVQEALEAAAQGRTTITIAHRLSTIKNADNIVVMAKGKVIEQGTHGDLIQKRGAYFDLVEAQDVDQPVDKTSDPEDDDDNTLLESKPSWADEGRNGESSTAIQLRRYSTVGTIDPGQDDVTKINKATLWDLVKLIASFNKQEKLLMLCGLFFSIISGAGTPVQTIFLAKAISTLSTPITSSNQATVKRDSDFWAAMYVMLAGVLGISYAANGILFGKCSERLIHRARLSAFNQILRQDISYFDNEENTSGALTSFLSTTITDVAGLSGVTLGNILMILTTIIVGLVIGIAIGWKLALVSASTIPLLVACGYYRFAILAHFDTRAQKAYASSASYASEAVSAIRTINSLNRETDVLEEYRRSLEIQRSKSLYSILKSSFVFALSESLTFLILALCFWYGGTLIAKLEYSMFQFFVCFCAVVFSAQSAGAFFSYAASMSKAYLAAKALKDLFERKPSIDVWSEEGDNIDNTSGHIELRNVHFHYPTRPDHPVLGGIDLDIKPGQYVALVGASGCGKSTIIQLLERFYNPTKGSIFLDGKSIKGFNINRYRSQIALVGQEPTLYQGTIRDNIALGSPEENLSDEDIKNACIDANIHDFIVSLPDGFDTVVGSKGGLLSGGQKQRIAIARALVRKPRVLLLDEATSALDSESERAVQMALDKAAKGRTTIAIAHRLSSIQKADAIFVFSQGRIVEQGTHNQLLQKKGVYAELINLQSLEEN